MRKKPTGHMSDGPHGRPKVNSGDGDRLESTEAWNDNPNADVGGDPIVAPMRSKLETVAVDPGLHIVSTPIGNLADITLRALAVLSRAHVIACEDTRVTGKLKSTFGLTAPLFPYHEHNAAKATPRLIERLEKGQIVALVSDAGTPLVSDPGYRLVGAAIEAGGSTLRDHRTTDGGLGYFQFSFAVYGCAGEPCPGCNCDISRTQGIQRLEQGGRSTYYCPRKQR